MLLAGMVGLFVIAGCTSTSREPDITGSNYEQIQVPAAADPLAAARTAFTGKKFAHAARYYEMALARQGDNTEALLGIAAAYDRMWRFDLSEPAYRRADPLLGGTPEYLNNRGYSYLMQGRFREAGQHLARAEAMMPDNPVIAGNLRLLQRLAGNAQLVHARAG